MSLVAPVALSLFSALVIVAFYLNYKRSKRERKNSFGNTFDFTKMPNSSIDSRKKKKP